MDQPTYSPLLNPSENVAELIAYQNSIGLVAGPASGAEPYEVLIGKAAFNTQQQTPEVSVLTVNGTADEVDVVTANKIATVSLPDVMSFIGKTVVGGTYSSITASGAFTGSLAGNATNVTGVVSIANGGTGLTSTKIYNVRNYGALGNNSSDDTASVNAAVAAINTDNPLGGATLYFPPGVYLLRQITQIVSRNVYIVGEGENTQLIGSGAGAGPYSYAMFDFTGSEGGIYNVTFNTNVLRSENSPLVKVANTAKFSVYNTSSTIAGDLFYFYTINWVAMSNVFHRSNQTHQGIVVRTNRAGLRMDGCVFSNNNSAGGVTRTFPVAVLEGGDTTGTLVSNTSFSGGGALYKYTGASVTSSSVTSFVVTFAAAHNFGINEYLVIEGAATSGYNGRWRVESISGNTATVLSTANLGTSAITTVTSAPCACYINNKYGAYNESQFSNILFEAVGYPDSYPNTDLASPMSCGLFIDGTKGAGRIAGWTFSSCYFDYGRVGALVIGGGTTGLDTNVNRIMFNGCRAEGNYRYVSIEQCSGVLVNNLTGPEYAQVYGSYITGSTGIYVWGRSETGGIQISNSSLGGYSGWVGATAEAIFTYGVHLDGKIQSFTLTGCNVQGRTASVYTSLDVATPLTGAYVKSSGNVFYLSSANPPDMTTSIPSVATAATISLAWNDTITITGAGTINTINGGWQGREVTLIAAAATVLSAAGNIAVTKTLAAGETVSLIYTGSSWKIAL